MFGQSMDETLLSEAQEAQTEMHAKLEGDEWENGLGYGAGAMFSLIVRLAKENERLSREVEALQDR